LRCIQQECGPDTLDIIETEEGGIKIALDASRIRTHAVPALEKFLLCLQVYRSTADVERGVALLDKYSDVDETWARYRSIVVAEKELRIQYVQPNTVLLESGNVEVRKYPPTVEGLIQSWVERSV